MSDHLDNPLRRDALKLIVASGATGLAAGAGLARYATTSDSAAKKSLSDLTDAERQRLARLAAEVLADPNAALGLLPLHLGQCGYYHVRS